MIYFDAGGPIRNTTKLLFAVGSDLRAAVKKIEREPRHEPLLDALLEY